MPGKCSPFRTNTLHKSKKTIGTINPCAMYLCVKNSKVYHVPIQIELYCLEANTSQIRDHTLTEIDTIELLWWSGWTKIEILGGINTEIIAIIIFWANGNYGFDLPLRITKNMWSKSNAATAQAFCYWPMVGRLPGYTWARC